MAFLSVGSVYAADTVEGKVYLHYYRFDQNYTNWDAWVWQNEPVSGEGSAHQFVDDTTPNEFNFGGKVAILDKNTQLNGSTKIGIIIRKGNWEQKDVDADRFITLDPAKSDEHFYFVEGDFAIGISLNDPNGPSRYAKFKTATFTNTTTISFTTTHEVTANELKIMENNVELSINIEGIELSDDKKSGKITLANPIDLGKSYVLSHQFSDNSEQAKIDISFDGLYNSDEFNDQFAYDGDLGAIYSASSTTFKVWAPISTNVVLNVYDSGTPQSLGGSNVKQTYQMIKKDKGIFEVTVAGDLHGKYYTYDVTNGSRINQDIVDPYAKSVGINGLRGMIVDFTRTNPEGWNNVNTTPNITNKTDAIIYELHVRDLTTHSSWNGTEANRGKWLGLIETGTKYEGLSTGFDHIKELGITHLQILPFFDYGNAIDETKQNDPTYNSFNWGYMPLNFNAIEGNYSANPYDGLVRINELKQVVKAYDEAGIKINMDVVYNHTGLSADSNFNLIVPGYYHRFTSTGAYSNGSGTGNETASERYMVRKFIVDSVMFWAEEYKLGGFRFDLMALHDVETMNELSEKLHQLNPNILIYGEPWTGGTSTLPESEQAGKQNIVNLDRVGAFNDDTRDGIKGSVFSSWMGGFVQGDFTTKNKVKYGITGGISHVDNAGYNVWHGNPGKIINYVTAHDNNTLHDKLYLSLEPINRLEDLEKISLQAHGLILTSQGIPFIHAGDEFLRSKELPDGKFDHNSYQSPDSVNQIQWNWKKEYQDHYKKFKKILDIRNEHAELRMASNETINQNLRFVFNNQKGVISYIIKNPNQNTTLLVIANANTTDLTAKLPAGNWKVELDTVGNLTTASKEIKLEATGFYILSIDKVLDHTDFESTMKESKNNLVPVVVASTTSVVAIGLGVVAFFVIKKKKGQ
ncbi:type I pullulanase [Acholeplasma hippikon]|nr:type I pullulanase [Acholeplasma hippikon]